MKIVFKTNIDKYKGKFPSDFTIIPRVGEFVGVDKPYHNHTLPFDSLEVKRVTYRSDYVEVELHLSELQGSQVDAYKLDVF